MELTSYFEKQNKIALEFKDYHPEVWEISNGAYLVSKTVISEVATSNYSFEPHEFQVFLFWQTTLDYQIESLNLIIRKHIDIGLGCLRLASELVRNSARLLELPELLSLIQKPQDSITEKEMRRSFKFKTSDPNEKYLYELYKLTSTYGIHGHNTSDLSRTPSYYKGDKVMLTIKDREVLKIIILWLSSFFPIQNVFNFYFGQKIHLNSSKYYYDYLNVFNNALPKLKKDLGQ